MGVYFHPWRKKLGVAMLLFACAWMLGWERSLYFWDQLVWEPGSLQLAVESHDSHFLVWADHHNSPFKWSRPSFASGDFTTFSDPIGVCHRPTCLLCSAGIRFRIDKEHFRFAVPYVLIVAPLSLVSAYLLFERS